MSVNLHTTAADGAGMEPTRCCVIGSGPAGLLASHVAARYFNSVTLIEGDSLKVESAQGSAAAANMAQEGPKLRPGVPQYDQPHLLVAGGLKAIEEMLPGFRAELVCRGGVEVDMLNNARLFNYGGVMPRGESDVKVVGASRHLYNSAIQDAVLARNAPWLNVHDGCRVVDLLWSDDKSSVKGVKLEGGQELAADLVIVATGRTPRLPQWLKAAGYAEPPVNKVDPRLVYAKRAVRMPSDWAEDWLWHATYDREGSLHGANLLPTEGNVWQVYAFGTNGIVPPADEEGFMNFLRALPDPEIYRAMQRAEPLTPIAKYGVPAAFQRRWDEVPLPGGVIALGDAVQGVNPIYGQGITAAALAAQTLEEALHNALAATTDNQEERREALHGIGPAFHARLLDVLEPAWRTSTAEDLEHPETAVEGDVFRPPPMLASYLSAVSELCRRDVRAQEIMVGIVHLLYPTRDRKSVV